jgi:valyl-tRNA synthetase
MQSAQNVPEKLLKPYEPSVEEKMVYELWEKSGYFDPDKMIADGHISESAQAYTIVLPPPNVTGTLHMGHALGGTVQDILIRYKRMNGFKALWIPGTDHAAIATQSKVEKDIKKKEGLSRHDLGREELLKRVSAFAKESHDTMVEQIKTLGFSCDWSREAFTLDEKRSLAVRTIFKKMYDDGLIVRKNKIINWDPKGQTTISDDEIVYIERKSTLYTFKYSHDFPIAISTTRPETKVGDVAVAVHPDDSRYSEYVGKEYDVVFCGAPIHIKIIADEAVEKDFGTGALGVTPAHSIVDWEMADRHDLPRPQIISEYAKIINVPETSPVYDKKVSEAREIIVAWLKEQNLLIEEKEINQSVATAERTEGIIEPLPKLQWFIDVNKPIAKHGDKTLKDLMLDPVKNGSITLVPSFFDKTYFNWVENLRDWCISRQIWYGHRIPVWYPSAGSGKTEPYCGVEAPEGEGWSQDEDSLDTWFSSALWTFSTLGWPEDTKDLQTYHPTSTLVTAYEIIFFWVARMVLMTEYELKTIPFKTVYFTGVVRDSQGRKFSKSLGNGIDPLDVASKYGSDAGRMALVLGTAPGTDMKLSEEKIKGQKLFANKIWNITRFILSNIDGMNMGASYTTRDQELLSEWKTELTKITQDIEEYSLHTASESIYHYIWDTLASTILEESKPLLISEDVEAKQSRQKLLYTLLTESITVLHPFMPFVTETIWQILPYKDKDLLMISKWPGV